MSQLLIKKHPYEEQILIFLYYRLCRVEVKKFKFEELSTKVRVVNQSKLLTTKPNHTTKRLNLLNGFILNHSKRKIWFWFVKVITILETRNPHCFYRYTTDKFILQILLTKGSWCLSKSKFPVCAIFNSFYEEIPEKFLDETDLDSYFYHNNFDISQSQHQIVRISRGSYKKSFAINLSQICDIKTQQRYILQEDVIISKRELTSLVESLGDFLKTFDHASKCIQIAPRKPNVEIGATKSKDNLFAHHYMDIIENLNRQLRLLFRFGNNNSCLFPIKKIELPGSHYILTDFVNLNHREIHHLYKNRYYVAKLQTSVR